MAPKKRSEQVEGLGVNLNTAARAKLDLIAAGLDRPIGWVAREAVASYLAQFDPQEFKEFRRRFPKLAAALDEAIKASGGDNDEIYGRIDDGISVDTNSKSDSKPTNPDSK